MPPAASEEVDDPPAMVEVELPPEFRPLLLLFAFSVALADKSITGGVGAVGKVCSARSGTGNGSTSISSHIDSSSSAMSKLDASGRV